MPFVIPFWLKIVGPIAALALLIGGVMAWGGHKYHSGYGDGVSAADAKWVAAGEQLKKDAAKSATKADDAAANRLADHVNEIAADQAAVNQAEKEGRSPLDVLFGN